MPRNYYGVSFADGKLITIIDLHLIVVSMTSADSKFVISLTYLPTSYSAVYASTS
jgi:hypothetical protein